MSTTYRAVHLLGKGGLSQLTQVELPLVSPGPAAAIRVRASRRGLHRHHHAHGLLPRTGRPSLLVHGYEVVGEVDALGPGVTGFRSGSGCAR